jgi:hypothetical protein
MSEVIEFGFDQASLIKAPGCDPFKQTRPGEVSRVSIISFHKRIDVILREKANEKGGPLTDSEKADLIQKVDERIAAQLSKNVADLTEVDRLDVRKPKFAMAFTHYSDGVGTVRCKSKREGANIVKAEMCCDRIGDADQTAATLVIAYPTDKNGEVDIELINRNAQKYITVGVWKLGSKKFKKVDSEYKGALEDSKDKVVLDLIVELDGDPKYQKQIIKNPKTALWCRDDFNPEARNWILEQGLRNWKYVANSLGFDMKLDAMGKKLDEAGGKLSGGSSSDDKPRLSSGSYKNLLD